MNLNDKILLLVTSKAKVIATKRAEKIRAAVSTAATLWRNSIKRRLSRPYPGRKNLTDMPFMRTGSLRNSVPRYDVRIRKTFTGGSRYDIGQIAISMRRVGAKAPWDTYGEELNYWDHQPTRLTGWKDRAYEALSQQIDKQLGFTKGFFRF